MSMGRRLNLDGETLTLARGTQILDAGTRTPESLYSLSTALTSLLVAPLLQWVKNSTILKHFKTIRLLEFANQK